jgi:hypothetical protein
MVLFKDQLSLLDYQANRLDNSYFSALSSLLEVSNRLFLLFIFPWIN